MRSQRGEPHLRHKMVDIGQHQREHKGDSKTWENCGLSGTVDKSSKGTIPSTAHPENAMASGVLDAR